MQPQGVPWPTGKSRCRMVMPKFIRANEAERFTYDLCWPCYRCMRQMDFNCSETYKIRVMASAGPRALYAPSNWTDEMTFLPTCRKGVRRCRW